MKIWRWARLFLALAIGSAAGFVVWMLPPTPRSTFQMVPPANKYYWLERITSDGQFVIFHRVNTRGDRRQSVEVWNLDGDLQQPWIRPEEPREWKPHWALSPDETIFLAPVLDETAIELRLFNLRTGRVTGQHKVAREDRNFFGPNGKLYDYSGGSLVDLDAGKPVGPCPVSDDAISFMEAREDADGASFQQCGGRYVMLHDGPRRRLHCCLTGQTVSEINLSAGDWHSEVACDDGTVWTCYPPDPPVAAPKWPPEFYLFDSRTGVWRSGDRFGYVPQGGFSPDGSVLCYINKDEPAAWFAFLLKWLGKDDDPEPPVRMVRWAENEELARFRMVRSVCFSPTGNLFAVLHHDSAIDVYDFPFRKPWRAIVGIGIAVALAVWILVWLWSRRIARTQIKPASGPVSTPDQAEVT